VYRWIIGAVYDLAALFFLHHKARIDERGQVMGQCRRREAQMQTDFADTQAFSPGLHECSKYRQARIVAKGGKGAGRGAGCCHVINIPIKLVL